MPVLPLVGSTMVSPALSRPSRSAERIISSAMRSLIDPPGLPRSTLATISAPLGEASLRTRTSGVRPMRPRTSSAMRSLTVDSEARAHPALERSKDDLLGSEANHQNDHHHREHA